MCAKNYENWPTVDKVIAKVVRLAFLAHPVGTLRDAYAVYTCPTTSVLLF